MPDENVLGPVGPGLQDRDRDPERGPDRHRRPDDRRRARARSRPPPTYVKERKQFGKAIAEFQGVQFQLAQMATELEAARLMVYNAARLKDAGQPFASEAAMAKLFSSQVAERMTSQLPRAVRRLRVLEGVPGREVLPRRQDRHDL